MGYVHRAIHTVCRRTERNPFHFLMWLEIVYSVNSRGKREVWPCCKKAILRWAFKTKMSFVAMGTRELELRCQVNCVVHFDFYQDVGMQLNQKSEWQIEMQHILLKVKVEGAAWHRQSVDFHHHKWPTSVISCRYSTYLFTRQLVPGALSPILL